MVVVREVIRFVELPLSAVLTCCLRLTQLSGMTVKINVHLLAAKCLEGSECAQKVPSFCVRTVNCCLF